jgi:hypothetical protein
VPSDSDDQPEFLWAAPRQGRETGISGPIDRDRSIETPVGFTDISSTTYLPTFADRCRFQPVARTYSGTS